MIKRVFEGGVGMLRGGIVERSIDIGVRDPLEDGREDRGEVFSDDILLCICSDVENMMSRVSSGSDCCRSERCG